MNHRPCKNLSKHYPYIYFHTSQFMMMMMNLLSFHKMRPFHLKQFKFLNNQIPPPSSTCYRVQAMTKGKEDSSESSEDYEIDRDKAREALKKLDQQLQSLSTKQVSSPKLRGMYVLSLDL